MASTFSDLGIELMATGENAGTWGTKTNTNLQIVEKAIAGYVEQAVTSGGTTALSITDGDTTESTSVARHAVIKLTGTISGNSIVTVPDSIEKVYVVVNGTSGSYTVQFKTASGTGVTFGATEKTTKMVFSDGTNIVDTGFALGVAADDISTGDAAVTIGTSTGDITIDSPADIVLDADGADVLFKDGGTTIATLSNSSSDFVITTGVQDKDFIVKGDDGGSAITALTLDMSAAGAATFNDKIIATELDISGNVDVDGTLEADAYTLEGSSFFKIGGTNFTDSVLFGHATSGTLDAAIRNTGVGSGALDALTSGDKNTAVGRNAGGAITTGSRNTLMGQAAGHTLSGGEQNTAYGDSAMTTASTSADYNSAFGVGALASVDSGDYNLGLGWQSGDALTSGKGNVIIGSNADVSSNTGDRQLVISGYDGSTTTTWIQGDSNGIVTFADDILIKDDGTIGSASAATAMTIESSGQVNFVGDINVADDVFMSSDSAQFTFGANSEIRLQHVHNAGLQILHTATGDDSTVNLTLATDEADIAVDDVIGILNFQAPSEGTGTDSRLVAASIAAVSEGDFAADNNATKLSFRTAASETASEKMSLSSDGTLTVLHDVILANDSFVQFGDAGEKIVGDGTNLEIDSSGTLTLDADGQIHLDVGSPDFTISFKADGSQFGHIKKNGTNFDLKSSVSDTDITFRGNDGGSGITALTLDMSDAGTATFNHDIILANNSFIQFGDAGENIAGDGTDLTITTSNDFKVDCAGDIVLDADGAEIELQDNGVDFGRFIRQGNDLDIRAMINDGDITFLGSDSDGGGLFTAGTFDMSDAGTLILNHDLVIADGGQIGSASDTDAMAISSGGVVTFSQAPVVPIGGLDIDGATDIGADLADADLFIVDDGAGGTNRKLAASRLTTYINANANFASVGKAIAMAIVFG
jgi:hypothetical protein